MNASKGSIVQWPLFIGGCLLLATLLGSVLVILARFLARSGNFVWSARYQGETIAGLLIILLALNIPGIARRLKIATETARGFGKLLTIAGALHLILVAIIYRWNRMEWVTEALLIGQGLYFYALGNDVEAERVNVRLFGLLFALIGAMYACFVFAIANIDAIKENWHHPVIGLVLAGLGIFMWLAQRGHKDKIVPVFGVGLPVAIAGALYVCLAIVGSAAVYVFETGWPGYFEMFAACGVACIIGAIMMPAVAKRTGRRQAGAAGVGLIIGVGGAIYIYSATTSALLPKMQNEWLIAGVVVLVALTLAPKTIRRTKAAITCIAQTALRESTTPNATLLTPPRVTLVGSLVVFVAASAALDSLWWGAVLSLLTTAAIVPRDALPLALIKGGVGKLIPPLLVAVGVIWGIVAFNIDTTVESGRNRVHNIGMMDERRNHLIVAGVLVLVGAIVFGVGGTRKGRREFDSQRTAATEGIRAPGATPFLGERALDSDAYQLYLVRKYAIEKNGTLEKYVVNDRLFPALDPALRYAHDLDVGQDAKA